MYPVLWAMSAVYPWITFSLAYYLPYIHYAVYPFGNF